MENSVNPYEILLFLALFTTLVVFVASIVEKNVGLFVVGFLMATIIGVLLIIGE